MDWLEDRSSPTPNNCTRANMRAFFSTRLNLKASPGPLIALSRTRSARATRVVQPLHLMSSFSSFQTTFIYPDVESVQAPDRERITAAVRPRPRAALRLL